MTLKKCTQFNFKKYTVYSAEIGIIQIYMENRVCISNILLLYNNSGIGMFWPNLIYLFIYNIIIW